MTRSSHLWFLFSAALCFAFSQAAAQGSRTLARDTTMNVRGSFADSSGAYLAVKFKGGTEVVLDTKGNVIKGTLADDVALSVSGSSSSTGYVNVMFKGGTSITFDANRKVVAGTLASDTTLNVRGSSNARGITSVPFKGGTAISFDNQHNVVRGVLASDTTLVPSTPGAAPVRYKARTTITFDANRKAAMIWEPIGNEPSASGSAAPKTGPGGAVVNETLWIVNGTPDPWVFHKNGTFGVVSGKWKGTWRRQADGYLATITNQGITDTFLIVFSADGKSFKGIRNGEVRRTGVRKQ